MNKSISYVENVLFLFFAQFSVSLQIVSFHVVQLFAAQRLKVEVRVLAQRHTEQTVIPQDAFVVALVRDAIIRPSETVVFNPPRLVFLEIINNHSRHVAVGDVRE